MKPRLNLLIALIMATIAAGVGFYSTPAAICAVIQQGPGRGPISAPRDPVLEKESLHNLEVAKYYFYKRKPPNKNDKEAWERLNKAIESRLMEIIDTNPTFAKMDEVYFLLGEVFKRSGDLDQAIENWNKVIKEFPDSQLKVDAQKRLDEAQSQAKEKKG